MIDYKNDEQKRTNLIHFIRITQQIIEEEGLKNLSIRKIAALSGFHNSTIYLYFKDLDELIMLASIKRFQKYSNALEQQSNRHTDAYDNFYAIWECFAESAFQHSCIFHNFFFGKYSDDLPTFLNIYYELFPEERNKYSADIEAMYFGKNYTERCLKILLPLKNDPRTCVTDENIQLINEMIVCFCKELLSKKCADLKTDNALLQRKLMDMLHFVVDK